MLARTVRSDLLLLLAAAIWGLAFVAQRVGMEHMGPFAFNAVRFALGVVSLIPVLYYFEWRGKPDRAPGKSNRGALFRGGAWAGAALFFAVSLQQIGLVHTTAGKAGFITGLYIIIVPIMGLFRGQRTDRGTWLGAFLALIGLYLLSVTEDFTLALGDLLVLAGAFFWAAHILVIARWSQKVRPLELALVQFICCALLSLIIALIFETIQLDAILAAAIPIAYAGIASVGVAYTLQVIAQRHAPPAHAAVILSLEAVFAAIGGWLMLEEWLSWRGFMGCALMMAGMLASQFTFIVGYRSRRPG
jgi:drug/metabolite transporter (DMT)-like permease